jgi:hypothetical protein
MQITKIIDTQVDTPTTQETATTLNSATCIRLFNDSTHNVVTVSLASSVGAATSISFSIGKSSTEFLQKLPTDVIYTSHSIKANKVGFTN